MSNQFWVGLCDYVTHINKLGVMLPETLQISTN